MSRARRMLNLISNCVEQNRLAAPISAPQPNQEIPNNDFNRQSCRKTKREESPIPEECQEQIAELQNLLGDVFNDHNLTTEVFDTLDPDIYHNTPPVSEKDQNYVLKNNPSTDENVSIQVVCSTSSLGADQSTPPVTEKDHNYLTENNPSTVENFSAEVVSHTSSLKAGEDILTICDNSSIQETFSTRVVPSSSSARELNVTQSFSDAVVTNNNRSGETFDITPIPSPIPDHHQDCNRNCENQFCPFHSDLEVPQNEYENIGTPSEFSTVSNVPTPSSTASTRTKTYKIDKGKKRLVHKDRWVTVVRKLKKNCGEEFVNKKGKIVEEKRLKDPCSDKCRLKCKQKLTHEDRLRIFKYFWRLGEKKKHWEFVIKNTKKIPKRRQTTEVIKHKRQNTFHYFLPDSKKNAVKVCKTMFLNTISLSERVVSTAWKKYDGNTVIEEDKRGKYEHTKRVYNDEMVKSVCDHVRCFPVVEGHHTRKNSDKLYLEGVESISRMFKLYCEWFDSSKYSSKAITKRQYREIVNANFNLALHRPKKDKCDVCHVFENKSTCTDEEKAAFSKHQERKKRARLFKSADKQKAQTNRGVVAATFDFQKVLVTPYGEISILYYKRRLATLNFTIYNMASNVGTCYMWHESIAKRGSNEVSSCLFDFIQHHVEKGVKEFLFWSDNCAGQNRNRIVFSLYLLVAKKFQVTVTHRFLEKGHTQNEGDSVHATIERYSRHKSIWVPEEWYCIVRWAKSEGEPYIVKEVKQENIFNFKGLLANKNWTKNIANEKVVWSSVREVKVNFNQYDRIEYKYDLDDDPSTIIVIRAGMRNKSRLAQNFELIRSYNGPLPISKEKYKDLTDLCKMGIIASRYHDFYFNLTHTDAANLDSDSD